MTENEIDVLISKIAKAVVLEEGFEALANQEKVILSKNDLEHLRYRLHNPSPAPGDIDEDRLGLGGWIWATIVAIFEILYNQDAPPLNFIRYIAFGEYDWDQAVALDVLCRLSVDEKISPEIIQEINRGLAGMRHETHLRFAHKLIRRKVGDNRFENILSQLNEINFRLALAEVLNEDNSQTLSKEELVELAKQIIAGDGDAEEIQKMMELFDLSVPYPEGSRLFYYPENYDAEIDDLSKYNPSAEEIVEKCFYYKAG